jgi:selenocysteine lyase/cysteine desulfurase
MEHVTLYGRAARRAPTAFFTVAGQTPRQVAEHLAARQVNVWSGDNYAWELAGALGLRDSGGAVRAGLVHWPAWCTTTTRPTSTGCWLLSQSSPDGVR